MAAIGYTLSSEDHSATDLVAQAVRAEQAGFEFAFLSDHYHPWTTRQGESPFVWCVVGGVAEATSRLRLVTGVTCPTMRIHPAIIAQAAATAATMLPERFALGVGSGEKLNEHILGDPWPSTAVRHDMLEEAVAVIRQLWTGQVIRHRGRHYTVDNARLYSRPGRPPPVLVAAAGPKAAALAGRIGNGLIATDSDPDLVGTYHDAGGSPPLYGSVKVCWAPDAREAVRQAHRLWPTTGLGGELGQELAMPAHFEQATALVDEDDVAEAVVCGPDPDRHVAAVRGFLEAGFDHVAVHQVGADQAGFLDFYEREVLPRVT